MKTYSNFTSAYHGLLKDVYHSPEHEASPRGLKVKERLGHSFRITDIRDRLPYIPHRQFSIAYFVAEMIWYLSGNDSTEWISYYSSFWKNISDDGKTANSAYGSRIFKQHKYQVAPGIGEGWTQWQFLKDELKKDPDSRRAVIHIRMPQDSALATKDVPCTLTLQFFIRDGALHQVASMRSSDLVLGIALDVPAFTMFQELLALELDVECGSYTHISNSLHIYEKNYAQVEKILADPWVKQFPGRAKSMPKMPGLPPLDLLNEYESKLRIATDAMSLGDVVRDFCASTISGPAKGTANYWQDWVFILASHRALKLDLPEFREKLIKTVKFPGYSLFER